MYFLQSESVGICGSTDEKSQIFVTRPVNTCAAESCPVPSFAGAHYILLVFFVGTNNNQRFWVTLDAGTTVNH